MKLLSQQNYSLMIRTIAFLMAFFVAPAMAADLDVNYCTRAHDAAAARLRWALAQQHDGKLQTDDSCRVYRDEFYQTVVTRQTVTLCEQGAIRERALQAIDAEINAFNDLIATSCVE
jgi:hypothetical protein